MKLKLFAPAKINLGLAVTGKLKNGYHTLDTLFTALDVGDFLTLEPINAGIDLKITGLDLPAGPYNLVYQAAERYLNEAKILTGIRITLDKRLPIAAGLGGGSSDAASTLLGLARIFPSSLDLPALAKSLGADVPFFLQAGACRAQGIGEILEPIVLPGIHLVLANPGVGISAKEAYAGLRDRYGDALDMSGILIALRSGLVPPYRNDLEIPVCEAYPIIQNVQSALEQTGLFGALMSGSGSTCFALALSAEHAHQAAHKLRQTHPNWWICATKTRSVQTVDLKIN